jgi:hypothetical protein
MRTIQATPKPTFNEWAAHIRKLILINNNIKPKK